MSAGYPDLGAAEEWLHRLFGDAPGLLSVVHMDARGTFQGAGGTVAGIPAALDRIRRLDEQGARGIYLRCTTVRRPLAAHERGAAADSHALPGLWADVDYGTRGHKPGPGLPLPPDQEQARRIVTESGLPAPSVWVHSGGGWYPWWLLDEPLTLDEETRPVAADLSAAWQQALRRSAARLGYDYGAGVGDLARVLRIPGTVNRKDEPGRPCRVTEDSGAAYALADLLTAAAAIAAPRPAPAPPRPVALLDGRDTPGPFDVLDRHVSFGDVLAGAGFTRHEARHPAAVDECWTRPGDPDNPCSAHTLTANPAVLVVHSELAGLPTGGGQRLTRGRVFAHLHHAGDEAAAARDLRAAIAGRPCTPAAAALPLPRDATARSIDRGSLAALETAPAGQADEGHDEAVEASEIAGATWLPVDLHETVAGLLDGSIERLAPTVGRRSDGAHLFYRGKVNGIAGASGCGKSWTVLHAAAQEIRAGEHAVYCDLEDDAAGVVQRLLDLGADPRDVLAMFHYVHPDEAYSAAAAAHLEAVVTEFWPSLVVVDSTGEALALDGAKPNDDDDVARWFRRLPTRLARTGAAVVVLDHIAKADDGGLWPIGSQRKRAAISGSLYMQAVVRPFDQDTPGVAKLTCAKDRHGTYRQGARVADLHITPHGDVLAELRAPVDVPATGERKWRPTGLMERIAEALDGAPEPLSFRGVDERVSGKADHKRIALRVLVDEAYVTVSDGPRNAKLHTLVRPYRQRLDPASDLYVRPGHTQPPDDRVSVSVSLERDTGHTHSTVSGTQWGHSGDTLNGEELTGLDLAAADPEGPHPQPVCPSCAGPVEMSRADSGLCCLACYRAARDEAVS